MGNEIPLQLAQFFRSILLGSTLALLYDLTRALSAPGGRWLELLLDTLLSISATAALFLLIMAEEGELRLFMLLGTLGGAVLFFALLSSVLRPIWAFWVKTMLYPFYLGNIFLKKLHELSKKVFSFILKWFTIITGSDPTGEEEEHDTQTTKTENAPQR